MLRALTSAGLAVLALTFVGGGAQAKSPGWVITGGDLGASGHHFFTDFADQEILATAREDVDAAQLAPSTSYDIYRSYGNLAVPYQMATEGPAFRYYPDERLIETPASDRWFDASSEVATTFDQEIAVARIRKAAGELEPDPIAAEFRARGLDQVSYWLRPVDLLPLGEPERYSSPMGGDCDGCLALPQPSEVFVLEHLVDTIESPVERDIAQRPAFIIEYYGVVGNGGIGGLLGFYAAPEDGRPGRFWYDGYFYDQTSALSHATTPGLDDYMAQASATGAPPPVASAAEEEGRGPSPLRTILGGSAALAIASAMFVTLAARRLRS